MIMKIFMLAAVVSLTVGCTALHPAGCHKLRALDSCSSTQWDDQDEFGAQARAIRSAINVRLADPFRWRGKQCILHIKFSPDGTAKEISTPSGDKAYCSALKEAAEKAQLPAFTPPDLYQYFRNTNLNMKG